jgi:hypothetical protein
MDVHVIFRTACLNFDETGQIHWVSCSHCCISESPVIAVLSVQRTSPAEYVDSYPAQVHKSTIKSDSSLTDQSLSICLSGEDEMRSKLSCKLGSRDFRADFGLVEFGSERTIRLAKQ